MPFIIRLPSTNGFAEGSLTVMANSASEALVIVRDMTARGLTDIPILGSDEHSYDCQNLKN